MDGERINNDQPHGEGGLSRGSDGRFAKGNPGGPGNPLGGQATALKSIWLQAGKRKFTAEVADLAIDKMLSIIRDEGSRDRDRIAALSLLVNELGVSLRREPEPERRSGGVTVVMSFTPAPPKPVDFIDPPPA